MLVKHSEMGAFLLPAGNIERTDTMIFNRKETKTVYAYDDKGKYAGTRTLDWSDRSPISGRWQIPANMTTVKPPQEKDGFDIYFSSGAWEYKEIPKEEPEPAAEPYEPQADEVAEQDISREDMLEMIATLGDTVAEQQEQILELQEQLTALQG